MALNDSHDEKKRRWNRVVPKLQSLSCFGIQATIIIRVLEQSLRIAKEGQQLFCQFLI